MRNKRVFIALLLLAILIGGGGYYIYAQKLKADAQAEYKSAITTIEQLSNDQSFDKALVKTNAALSKQKDDTTLKNYQTQLEKVIQLKQSTEKPEQYQKSEDLANELTNEKKPLEGIFDYAKEVITSLTADKTELKTLEQATQSAESLAKDQKYEESNQVLEPVLAKSETGRFATVFKKATDLKTSNDQAIQKAIEEASKTITAEEALGILKVNLPDNFDNPSQIWAQMDQTEGHNLAFSGMSDGGGFRAIVYVDVLDANTINVIFETGSSFSADVTTERYQFPRTKKAQSQTTSIEPTDTEQTSESQKYLDAFAKYSGKVINVLPYNRGSGYVTPEYVAATGVSEELVYKYLDGIDDYYGKLWQDGKLTKEEFQENTGNARDQLFNGEFADNNDTIPNY